MSRLRERHTRPHKKQRTFQQTPTSASSRFHDTTVPLRRPESVAGEAESRAHRLTRQMGVNHGISIARRATQQFATQGSLSYTALLLCESGSRARLLNLV